MESQSPPPAAAAQAAAPESVPPKRTFRMLQPRKDVLRAQIASIEQSVIQLTEEKAQLTIENNALTQRNEFLLAQIALLERPWWQRLLHRVRDRQA